MTTSTRTPITRVVLADDHGLFRQGLAALLEAEEHVAVVGHAAHHDELLALVERERPDLAIVDVSMPGFEPVELPQRIAQLGAATKLLALTMHKEPALAKRLLAAGFVGYVLKENAFDDLVRAIEAVGAGEEFVTDSFRDQIEATGVDGLTTRERQVLEGIASGHTNKRIAADLGVSPKTIETYRARLFRKFAVHSAPELIHQATQRGTISLPVPPAK